MTIGTDTVATRRMPRIFKRISSLRFLSETGFIPMDSQSARHVRDVSLRPHATGFAAAMVSLCLTWHLGIITVRCYG